MADTAIPLSVQPVQIDRPLDVVGRGMSLQSMAQGIQMQKARLADEQDKARNRDEDRADEQIIQRAFTDTGGDYEKMRPALAGKVRMRNLQRLDADHLQYQRAMLGLQNEQKAQIANTNQLVGGESAALLQLPYEERVKTLPTALQRLQKAGIDTSQYQGFDPTDDNLKAIAARTNYMGQLLSWSDKQALEEQRKAAAKKATQQTAKDEQEEADRLAQRAREAAARTHLAVTNQAEHEEWLKSLPPSIAKEYTGLKKFDETTQATIQGMPLTSQQRGIANLNQQKADQTAELNAAKLKVAEDRAVTYGVLADVRQQMADIARERAERGQTANSTAVSQRQARNQYYKLADSEDKLNKLRYSIGAVAKDAASTGKAAVNKDGSKRDLDAEFRQATDELARVISDKYDAAVRAGMGEPSVPLDQALQAIRSAPAAAKVPPPAGAAQPPAPATPSAVPPPTPAPQPAPGGQQQQAKVFPRARLAAFAQANGIAPDAAETALKSQGYVIR